ESPAPTFQIDHVWVRADGQAVVLDFPCPGLTGAEADAPATDLGSLQQLLHRVADAARLGRDAQGALAEGPAPLPARAFLERLETRAFDSLELLRGNLESLTRQPAVVSARQRFNAVLLPLGIIVLFGVLVPIMQHHYTRRWHAEWKRLFPDKPAMTGTFADAPFTTEAKLRTFKLYLGGEFADVLTNRLFWESPHLGGWLDEPDRQFLTNSLMLAHTATPTELASARTAGPKLVAEAQASHARQLVTLGSNVVMGLLVFGGMVSGLVALITGQPLLFRLMGLALVDRHGVPASRGRALWRWVIGVVPLAVWLVVVSLLLVNPWTGAPLAIKTVNLVRCGAISLMAVLSHLGSIGERPWRAWTDKLSGTYVVPR
ncbi:MAG: hypothetical protein ACKODH_05655, partial [Limisphaerales bacterium]